MAAKDNAIQPRVIHLKDYNVPPYLVDDVYLDFLLFDDHAKVTSKTVYRANSASEDTSVLILNGKDLELLTLAIDGEAVPSDAYEILGDELHLSVPLEKQSLLTLTVETKINPHDNKSMEGLYCSRGMFCTQMESQGFRKVTYFQDRPDVLGMYTTRVESDKTKNPILLSNGNLVEQGDCDGGRHFAVWNDPHRKPGYLFALVAGDLAMVEDKFTTCSGRDVTLRIFVEHGQEAKTDHAMASLIKSMKWDEEAYGREYDLDIFMIVAVDDFNFGAMENKGLNVFNAALVLADPKTATDLDYQRIEGVVAHEYFHNWTGNRITCRDWFQLSLKEGLTVFRDQCFSGDMNSQAVQRINDVRALRAFQFPEDAGPMAHPIRPSSFVKIDNFYTATVYNKGAEVIRMMHTLLGEDGYRKGTDTYFERFDGQAVTTEDFVGAMEAGNDADFTQFKNWYNQAGTPMVKASGHYDGAKKQYALTLSQTCNASPGQEEKLPFVLPMRMGLLDSSGNDMPLVLENETLENAQTTRVLVVQEREQTFVFNEVAERPVPSLFRHFSAPIKLDAEYSLDQLQFLLANDSDFFNRWDAGQKLARTVLLKLVKQSQQGEALSVEPSVISAYGQLLANTQLDLALVAETWMLPSESEIGHAMDIVDVEGVKIARAFLRKTLATAHEKMLVATYDRLQDSGEYLITPEAMAQRKLSNVCMAFLTALETDTHLERAHTQLANASNMTDEIAALTAIANVDHDKRQSALDGFDQRWRKNLLVMNKWFGVQAGSSLNGTLENVIRLQDHPNYDPVNPNKVRALVAILSRNQSHFHRDDGQGYLFIANQVLAADKRNAGLSGRLVGAFNDWKRFDADRQELMKAQLLRIQGTPGLSANVMEVVDRALKH
jgi:aminopeptidase N